jgi:hypothetical protein
MKGTCVPSSPAGGDPSSEAAGRPLQPEAARAQTTERVAPYRTGTAVSTGHRLARTALFASVRGLAYAADAAVGTTASGALVGLAWWWITGS